jgi:hypothetical protein
MADAPGKAGTTIMNQLAIVLITALVTGIISISAVWLGSHLTRENEIRKWRRDQALEAYVDVLKASATVYFESVATYLAECNTEEQTKHVHLVMVAVAELHGLANKVLLLSPKEMFDDFQNLASYLSKEIVGNSLKCPKIPNAEWDRIQGADFVRVQNDFILAARNDLGIHAPLLTAQELMKFNQQWKRETAK